MCFVALSWELRLRNLITRADYPSIRIMTLDEPRASGCASTPPFFKNFFAAKNFSRSQEKPRTSPSHFGMTGLSSFVSLRPTAAVFLWRALRFFFFFFCVVITLIGGRCHIVKHLGIVFESRVLRLSWAISLLQVGLVLPRCSWLGN